MMMADDDYEDFMRRIDEAAAEGPDALRKLRTEATLTVAFASRAKRLLERAEQLSGRSEPEWTLREALPYLLNRDDLDATEFVEFIEKLDEVEKFTGVRIFETP